jgi:hypothetical protein
MIDTRQKCAECGALILIATAAANDGRCVPCANGTRQQVEQAKVRAREERDSRTRNREALDRIRGKDQPVLADFAAEEDPMSVLWPHLVDVVYRGEPKIETLDALMPAARVIYLAGVFDGEVMNGGIHQFFTNSSGRNVRETLAALLAMGATRAAGLLEQAVRIFPGAENADRATRNELLDGMDPDVFDDLDSKYYAMAKEEPESMGGFMLAYLQRHASQRVAK